MAADRATDIKTIHVLQRKLGLTADDAEALKLQLTGQASSAGMSDAQRSRLIGHLRKLERARFPDTARAPRHRSVDDPCDNRYSKARVLWSLLAKKGAVQHDTDAALTAYARRQTKTEHWRFMNGYQVNTVIESLKRWCVRAGVDVESH